MPLYPAQYPQTFIPAEIAVFLMLHPHKQRKRRISTRSGNPLRPNWVYQKIKIKISKSVLETITPILKMTQKTLNRKRSQI